MSPTPPIHLPAYGAHATPTAEKGDTDLCCEKLRLSNVNSRTSHARPSNVRQNKQRAHDFNVLLKLLCRPRLIDPSPLSEPPNASYETLDTFEDLPPRFHGRRCLLLHGYKLILLLPRGADMKCLGTLGTAAPSAHKAAGRLKVAGTVKVTRPRASCPRDLRPRA